MSLVDNFDTYNTGDLNGQGSWSGNAAFDVENSVSQTASNAVQATLPASGSYRIEKSFSTANDGVQSFYMRGTATNSRGIVVIAEDDDNNNNIVIYFNSNTGKLSYYYNSAVTDFATITNNTWYKIDVEWRSSDHKFRMRLDNGTWGAFGTPVASWTNGLNIVALDITNAGSGTVYWDSFSDPNTTYTSPLPAFRRP